MTAKFYYCTVCRQTEITTNDCVEVQHIHSTPNGQWLRHRLADIDPSGPMPTINLKPDVQTLIAHAALTSFEFKENGCYLVLADPAMIDVDVLASMDFSKFPVFNVLFLPVNRIGSKSLEDAVLFKDSIEGICDWLGKTLKCKIALIPDGEEPNLA